MADIGGRSGWPELQRAAIRSVAVAAILLQCNRAAASLELGGVSAPPQAAAVGYRKSTFSSTFSKDTVETGGNAGPRLDWYLFKFFGYKPSANVIVLSNEGVTIEATDDGALGGQLVTASPGNNGSQWTGLAFGGGAYFEATFKFDPATVGPDTRSWPAFWGMAIEHLANMDAQRWPGQSPDYHHFIEADFFEYDLFRAGFPRHIYGGALHDWYGTYNQTCPRGYCDVQTPFRYVKRVVPERTDFRRFHKVGFLWIPATEKTAGTGTYYFDDRPIGHVETWTKYAGQPPTPTLSTPWAWGIIDQQHLPLILGAGISQPMTIRSVNVWQASAEKNWQQ